MTKKEMLMDYLIEEVKKEIKNEKAIKDGNLFKIVGSDTYVNIDVYCTGLISEYFGLKSDAIKQQLFRKWYATMLNNNKYVAVDGNGACANIDGKLYVNRDFIDSYIFLYLLERMDIKNIKESLERRIEMDKSEMLKELYNMCTAEFQRRSPVFKNERIGCNKEGNMLIGG